MFPELQGLKPLLIGPILEFEAAVPLNLNGNFLDSWVRKCSCISRFLCSDHETILIWQLHWS